MRLRVCVSCLIWPDAVFRDHLHGHNSPPPQSWKSDLIDIITRLTYSVVSREAQDNCTRSIDFSLCCYTNALKRRKEGEGATSRWAHIAGRSDGGGRGQLFSMSSTLLSFSLPTHNAWPNTQAHQIFRRWIDLCPEALAFFFERERHFFCRGRRFGCDWGHLESRLSGRLVFFFFSLGS